MARTPKITHEMRSVVELHLVVYLKEPLAPNQKRTSGHLLLSNPRKTAGTTKPKDE
jgi:hypothetical protein